MTEQVQETVFEEVNSGTIVEPDVEPTEEVSDESLMQPGVEISKEELAALGKQFLENVVNNFDKEQEDRYNTILKEYDEYVDSRVALVEEKFNGDLTIEEGFQIFENESPALAKMQQIGSTFAILKEHGKLGEDFFKKLEEIDYKAFKANLKVSAMVILPAETKEQIDAQLYQNINHVVMSVASFQLENVLRSLVERKRAGTLDKDYFDHALDTFNKVRDNHAGYLTWLGVDTTIFHSSFKVAAEVIDGFQPE